jgi:hypothetical protein
MTKMTKMKMKMTTTKRIDEVRQIGLESNDTGRGVTPARPTAACARGTGGHRRPTVDRRAGQKAENQQHWLMIRASFSCPSHVSSEEAPSPPAVLTAAVAFRKP